MSAPTAPTHRRLPGRPESAGANRHGVGGESPLDMGYIHKYIINYFNSLNYLLIYGRQEIPHGSDGWRRYV